MAEIKTDWEIKNMKKKLEGLKHDNIIDETMLSVCIESSSISTLKERMSARQKEIDELEKTLKAIHDEEEGEVINA